MLQELGRRIFAAIYGWIVPYQPSSTLVLLVAQLASLLHYIQSSEVTAIHVKALAFVRHVSTEACWMTECGEHHGVGKERRSSYWDAIAKDADGRSASFEDSP